MLIHFIYISMIVIIVIVSLILHSYSVNIHKKSYKHLENLHILLEDRIHYLINAKAELLEFLENYQWKPISTAPKGKVLLLGFDSTDCGWSFDVGFYYDNPSDGSESRFVATHPVSGSIVETERKYSHWMYAPGYYDGNNPKELKQR